MVTTKIIKNIKFNAVVNGKKYFNLDLGITPSHSYTNEDIDCEQGACFSTHIGRDFYDVIVYRLDGEYHISTEQIVRNKMGEWESAKKQNDVTIKNVKVTFCESLV